MGISAFVLFESGKGISASELLSYLKEYCIEEKLLFDNDEEEFTANGVLKYTRAYINDAPFAENCSRTLCFNIYDEPYEHQIVNFKWDKTQAEYFKAIISDDFCDNEDLLLKLLCGLIIKYPDAKIWTEDDWFYSASDMKKISSSQYNDEWCYINPICL